MRRLFLSKFSLIACIFLGMFSCNNNNHEVFCIFPDIKEEKVTNREVEISDKFFFKNLGDNKIDDKIIYSNLTKRITEASSLNGQKDFCVNIFSEMMNELLIASVSGDQNLLKKYDLSNKEEARKLFLAYDKCLNFEKYNDGEVDFKASSYACFNFCSDCFDVNNDLISDLNADYIKKSGCLNVKESIEHCHSSEDFKQGEKILNDHLNDKCFSYYNYVLSMPYTVYPYYIDWFEYDRSEEVKFSQNIYVKRYEEMNLSIYLTECFDGISTFFFVFDDGYELNDKIFENNDIGEMISGCVYDSKAQGIYTPFKDYSNSYSIKSGKSIYYDDIVDGGVDEYVLNIDTIFNYQSYGVNKTNDSYHNRGVKGQVGYTIEIKGPYYLLVTGGSHFPLMFFKQNVL